MDVSTSLRVLSSALIIAGAVIGYVPQYVEIARTQNEEGFSTGVSFVLLVSNTMRIFFWFGKAFELTLLYQSLAVIGCQLALLSLCVRVRNSKLHTAIRKRFTDYDWSFFWNWSDFESYIQLLLCLACGLFVLGTAFGGSPLYVETLGAIALGIESTPALPQAYKNHVSKSTDGLNTLLVIGWFVGDAYKTVYYVLTEAPIQFLASGLFQVLTDVYVLLQMYVLYPARRSKALSPKTAP